MPHHNRLIARRRRLGAAPHWRNGERAGGRYVVHNIPDVTFRGPADCACVKDDYHGPSGIEIIVAESIAAVGADKCGGPTGPGSCHLKIDPFEGRDLIADRLKTVRTRNKIAKIRTCSRYIGDNGGVDNLIGNSRPDKQV